MAEALSLVVKQRRIESESGEKRKDMLGALLASDDHGGFSDEGIVDFLVALLVAGYETTSTSMTLAVKFLTETPLALAQIMVSVRLVFSFVLLILTSLKLPPLLSKADFLCGQKSALHFSSGPEYIPIIILFAPQKPHFF